MSKIYSWKKKQNLIDQKEKKKRKSYPNVGQWKRGSSVLTGSGLVSHACGEHGPVKRHATVMLFKDYYYIYSALHVHR